MDGWEKIVALIVPLVMNWLEVHRLRKDIAATREKTDARIESIEERVSVLESQTGLVP